MKKIIMLSLTFLIACSDKDIKIVKYPNGNIKLIAPLNSKGFNEGESIFYYESGIIKSKTFYMNDTINSYSHQFYPNGKIQYIANFKKGKQEGVFFEFYADGHLKQKNNYKQGYENGLFLFYYNNGKLSMSGLTKKDTTQYYTSYDSLGKIIDKKHYMALQILSPLTTKDSIKIKEIIPNFITESDCSLFIFIERYNENVVGSYSKMNFNPNDSSYYYTFPPQKETGKFIIKTMFFANKKFPNKLDTLITITK